MSSVVRQSCHSDYDKIDAGHPRDTRIAEIANRQFGLVTACQLVRCGLSRTSISWRARHGRLHRVHRGVYAVGHGVLSWDARLMAAVLAAGQGAVVSRHCAIHLWGLSRRAPMSVEILVCDRRVSVPGVSIRMTRELLREETAVQHGIPVTTVTRTLVDLAPESTPFQLARIMHEAAFHRRLEMDSIERALERHRHRAKIATLREAVWLHMSGSPGTRSTLEDRFVAMLCRAGIEMPAVNQRVHVDGGALEVDLVWSSQRLCVEIDGSGHARPRSIREDARRDALLEASGYRVLRIAGREIENSERAVVGRVIRELRVRRWSARKGTLPR